MFLKDWLKLGKFLVVPVIFVWYFGLETILSDELFVFIREVFNFLYEFQQERSFTGSVFESLIWLFAIQGMIILIIEENKTSNGEKNKFTKDDLLEPYYCMVKSFRKVKLLFKKKQIKKTEVFSSRSDWN